MASAWGVWGKKTMYGKQYMGILRSAFVIDENGKVARRVLQSEPEGHSAKVTEALEG